MKVFVEIAKAETVDDEQSNITEIEIEPGTTLAQLGVRLSIAPDLAQMAWVNGEVRMGSHLLQDGDRIIFYATGFEEFESVQMEMRKANDPLMRWF